MSLFSLPLRATMIAAVLAIITTSTLAQTVMQRDPVREPPDGEPWRIERFAEIPRQLLQAVRRHRSCWIEESDLHELPVLVFRPAANAWVMAIMPCHAIIYRSQAFMFDRGTGSEPSLMMFPIAAATRGFTVSALPGLMTWQPATKTLSAYLGNDTIPSPVYRHTYRYIRNGDGDLNGFALVQSERGKYDPIGGNDWHVVWEATEWNVGK